MHRVLLGHALIILCTAQASASTGSADALFLSLDPFAASARLGCAAGATAAGPWACTSNPALLELGISASGGTTNLGASTVGAAAAFGLPGGVTGGMAVHWLGRGGLQGRDEQGLPDGEYGWSSGSLTAACAFDITTGLRAGLSAGPLWESAGSAGASGFAFSAGAALQVSDRLAAGAAVMNAGLAPSWNGIQKDMPVEICGGVRFEPAGFLELTCGGCHGLSTAGRYSAAAEIVMHPLSISAGWELVPGEEEAGGPFGGFSYTHVSSGAYSLDLSIRRDEFGWPLLAGLTARF